MPRPVRRKLLAAALLAGLSQAAIGSPDRAPVSGAGPAPLVAAASDLKFALDALIERFQRETGVAVRVTYGSSGNLARQIEQGAPFDLFLSADEAYVERLVARGLTVDRGTLYGIGRLAIFSPEGSPLRPDPLLQDLARRLAGDRSGRIAIANPAHAPYGRAAEQALRSLGLWDAVAPRLVFGENVAQAAQYASSGNVDGAIIAQSLALAPELRDRGSYALLPETLHEPLRQRMVLLTRAPPAAVRLYEYLQSPPARAILVRYGFALPGD